MNTKQVIERASVYLEQLPGHVLDVLDVTKPVSPDAALNLAKVVSKLSPLLGNMIEISTCEFLNDLPEFKGLGKWRRQDPGFPDIVFDGQVQPTPGFEVKAWFPLATEITARFKDSQTHFLDDRTYVAMFAWLPEFVIYGRPKIVGVVIASGASVAQARDEHYHTPPAYLVLEPEDTSTRKKNLQQTNTSGYRWQPNKDTAEDALRLKRAEELIGTWGPDAKAYSPSPDYQRKLKELMGAFTYRLDTNFAKIDRVGHEGIEAFAARVYALDYHGLTIGEWNKLLAGGDDAKIRAVLAEKFDIRDIEAAKALIR